MSWFGFLILSLSIALLLGDGQAASIHTEKTGEKCGYQACHKVQPKKLNIHLVAHTHDDVGWLKTLDQYYFGSRTNIQRAGVQYIIDSVIKALLDNPERRFIYVETAYLWKWWLRQSDKMKQDVKNLINRGRLEIIGGGWSMNDEAVTHYHSLVDQYTWGFRRLNDTFGSCARPHIGWQIDPFGHSREQASMFAQLGFDGMFFGRLDYQDKNKRLRDKNMEFIWKGSPSLGSQADLFTGVLYNNYSPPPGYCFDVLCTDDPIIDDPDSPDYNVDTKIDLFLRYAVQQSEMYRTNNVILTMGGDFTYQHAEMYFHNIDKLISHRQVEKLLSYAHRQAASYRTNNVIFTMGEDFNYQHAEMWFTNLDRLIRYAREKNGTDVNIIYSTPSCYLKALHDAKLSWPTKADDFFPYASDPHSYWTGYFSSRPTVKFFERMGNNLLQISKQLAVLTGLSNDYEEHLTHLREAMGVMQHHDAVTGTEKQLVAFDYSRLLYDAMQHGINVVSDAIKKWSKSGSEVEEQPQQDMYSCMQLNISSCAYTEDQNFTLTIYNPLSQAVKTPIRLPVQNAAYVVVDFADGSQVTSQLVPVLDAVQDIPGRESNATHELVFLATIPPLGYKSYKITQNLQNVYEDGSEVEEAFIINEFYNVSINDDGQLSVEWRNQKDMHLTQSFQYYEGMEGNNRVFENRSSGAYIFRPKSISAKNFDTLESHKIYKGPVVKEIHQTVNEWISQVIRIYSGKEYIEFDWLVGPIPVQDHIGKEIITKYSSNLNSSEEFYTDSNGREMLKRKRNYRPTWTLKLEEEVSGNYYPITTKISMKDEERLLKLSVLTDRAQGGTSMKDGEIELMLHRRLLSDDAFGVGEALNESAYGEGLVVRGSHYVVGGSVKNLDDFAMKEKSLALQMSLRPWTLITPITTDSETENYASTSQGSGLAKKMPPNVQILTLEPWKDGTILLRLEHIFEVGETENLSRPVEINIKDLFSTFTILSIEETTLGGNQWLKDMNRLKWEPETNDILQAHENIGTLPVEIDDVINVLLKPMQIRTFVVKTAPRKL